MADATIHGIEFEIKGNSDEASRSINAFASTLRRLKSATSGGLGLKAVSKEFGLLGATARGIRGLVSAPFKKGWENVAKYADGLGSVVSSFKRILGYRLIRTLIKEIGEAFSEGVKNVYQWSKAFGGPVNRAGLTFAETMNDIATSLAYFKNSVGAAVAPLFNVLAPAIRVVTDAAVQLLNVINQLFARLTGQSSWTRAIRHAEEYEDAVGGAGGAAKEALKYLAPFDELNVLPDDRKGGGGGSGGSDYSGIFEEVSEFESGIADFADRIRELIQNGEWAQLGQLIGDKINEIVNSIDWSGLGTKVGDKINALFTTEYWTLKTINFQNIGAKVAEFLTGDEGVGGALRSIDFSTFGALISEKLTILPDLVIGAVNNLDFKEVGKSLGDTFRGFFNNLSDWLVGIDFSELTENIINGIFDLIKGFDVKSAAESLLTFLAHVFKAVSDSLGTILGMIVNPIVDGLSDFFTNDDGTKKTGNEIVYGIFEGITDALSNFWNWCKENIFTPILDGIKNAFGIHSPAETMKEPGQMIAEGILEGIAAPFKAIGTWVDEHIFRPIREAIGNSGDGAIGEGIGISLGLDFDVQTLKDIKAAWDKIKKGTKNLTLNLKGNLKEKVIDKIGSAWEKIQDKTAELKAEIQEGIAERLSGVKEAWDGIKKGTKTLTAKLSGVKESVITKISNAWEKISTKGATLTANLVNNVSQSVFDWLAEKWQSLKSVTATFTAKLSASSAVTGFVSKWNELKDKTLELKATLTEKVREAWNKVATAWNGTTILRALGTLPTLANGGLLNGMGQLFIAREAGPELVGQYGSRTAVMNNDQIVASVSAGVARAIQSVTPSTTMSKGDDAEDVLYRAMLRALNSQDNERPIIIDMDGSTIYRAVVSRNKKEVSRTGNNPMMART